MDLRKELIDFTARLNDWSIAIPDDIRDCVINEHIQSINCASDETQADRQNEQTKDICPKCKTPFHFVLGNFICPNFDCGYTK